MTIDVKTNDVETANNRAGDWFEVRGVVDERGNLHFGTCRITGCPGCWRCALCGGLLGSSEACEYAPLGAHEAAYAVRLIR